MGNKYKLCLELGAASIKTKQEWEKRKIRNEKYKVYSITSFSYNYNKCV